jgi:hypothetical protein
VRVLPVEVDQAPARLGQGGGGGEAPVEVGAAAALPRDRPGQDQLVCGTVGRRGAVEHHPPLHPGLGRPGADHDGVGSAPHQQLDGVDHQRLARPRLAGHRGEAGPEDEVEVLDDPEVAHAQLAQHGHVTGR